ncbi:MAG: LysM peptidoglycan-binding domain-containing protein [Bacteroidales bacterium]|nr:LysM peptidoglycan-binding domain-containing protein [Bacteroidales bacterium]
MKNNLTIIFTFIFIISLINNICSQETEIILKRSEITEIINGQKFFIHKIKKGQTLYSISKTYNVSLSDIEYYNPGVSEGIKEGRILKIPFKFENIKKTENIIKHTVAKKQTLYSISKQYNVDVNEILKYNPDAKDGVSAGQILLIPLISSENIDITTEKSNDYIYHKIVLGETLYSLSKRYGIKIKQLKKDNPQLLEHELQLGEIIKISKEKIDYSDNILTNNYDTINYIYHKVIKKQTLYSLSKLYKIEIKQLQKTNPELKNRGPLEGEIIKIPKNLLSSNIIRTDFSKLVSEDSTYIDDVDSIGDIEFDYLCTDYDYKSHTSPFKVAFMLPFYTTANDTLENNNENHSNKENIYPRSRIFLEYYEGSLLAIDTLRKQGLDIDIYVYDTENDTNKIKTIINNVEIKQFDIIFGPVYSDNLEILSNAIKNYEVNIVSPFSLKKSFLKNNTNTFKLSPSFSALSNYASVFLNNNEIKNYIIVHDGDNINQSFVKLFKNRLFSTIDEKTLNTNNIYYKEVNYYNPADSIIEYSLNPDIENIIIIPYSDQAFISDVISKINALRDNYKIKVFGMPRWSKFENIEPEMYYNLNIHLFSNSFIDYKNNDVKKFVINHRNIFKSEPSKYCFQGYDITYYFLNALLNYGKDFRYCLNNYKVDLLQSFYNFKKVNKNSGYENNAIYLIEYNKNYEQKIVKYFPSN